jgi:hypothetical protein
MFLLSLPVILIGSSRPYTRKVWRKSTRLHIWNGLSCTSKLETEDSILILQFPFVCLGY